MTKDYYRDYYNVDTIHGIPMNHFRAQDIILNLMRHMMFKSIKDVQEGRDPKHIIRDPEVNDIYYVRGPDPAEHI